MMTLTFLREAIVSGDMLLFVDWACVAATIPSAMAAVPVKWKHVRRHLMYTEATREIGGGRSRRRSLGSQSQWSAREKQVENIYTGRAPRHTPRTRDRRSQQGARFGPQ